MKPNNSKISKKQRLSSRGFTLVELLLVIAIVSILAAMLLSALSGAKRRAQELGCKNNLKQLALAGFMYQTDFGPMNFANNSSTWLPSLLSYQGYVNGIRFCPMAPTNNIPAANLNGAVSGAGSAGAANYPWINGSVESSSCSYALNGWLYLNQGASMVNSAAYYVSTQTSVGVGGMFNKLEFVRHPPQTPIFSDAVWVDGWPDSGTQGAAGDNLNGSYNLYTGGGINNTIGKMMSRYCLARHGISNPSTAPTVNITASTFLPGGVNVACCDGHVEYSQLNNLWSYYWHALSVPQPMP